MTTTEQETYPRELIEELREEAAGLRKQYREVTERYADALTPDQVQTAVEPLQRRQEELQRNVWRRDAAWQFGVPGELVEYLIGDDKATITGSARKLSLHLVAPVRS